MAEAEAAAAAAAADVSEENKKVYLWSPVPSYLLYEGVSIIL